MDSSVADRFKPRRAFADAARDAFPDDLNEVAMDLTGVADRERVSTIVSGSTDGGKLQANPSRLYCRCQISGILSNIEAEFLDTADKFAMVGPGAPRCGRWESEQRNGRVSPHRDYECPRRTTKGFAVAL